VPIESAAVERKEMPVMLPAVGTVESISSVQVRAQVTGQLSAVHFREGQDVRKGQPLFSIDPRPFQAALQQAQAVLARDSATLQNARAQQARIENLLQRGLVPRDQAETQKASAEALAATVEADRAAVENARLNLQYAEIKAPIDGRTGALGVHVGDLVRANDTNPMIEINQLSPIYVTFNVPGRYLGEVRRFQARKPLVVSAVAPSGAPAAGSAAVPASSQQRGAGGAPPPVVVEPGAESGTATGVVSFIDNAVDSTTGTIRLKGTFQNKERQLWPGAFVQVTLRLTNDPDALVVPAVAVQASQEGQYVYVVKPDKTVEMRPVTLERQQGDEAVIAKGLSAGEIVVTDGHLRLTPGAKVAQRGEGRGAGGGRGANQASGRAGAGR
jgi:multidrug efflux system membrane fusion protein